MTAIPGSRLGHIHALRVRERVDKARFIDATLDVKLAGDRWEANPSEEQRVEFKAALERHLFDGRRYVAAVKDLLGELGGAAPEVVAAIRSDVCEIERQLLATVLLLRHVR